MVEVFRTNVEDELSAESIVHALSAILPGTKINFDLEDCDRILRVASFGKPVDPDKVIDVVHEFGYSIDVLE